MGDAYATTPVNSSAKLNVKRGASLTGTFGKLDMISDGLLVLNRLFPGVVEDGLWRTSFAPVFTASAWLVALGLMYFSIGYAKFAKGDAR